jgi:Zn-dependent M28 family amino/carboxypeptidase
MMAVKQFLKTLAIFTAVIALVVGLAIVWTVSQPIRGVTAAYAPADPALPERLKAHVNRLAIDFAPRTHTHVTNLDLAADYIRTQLAAATPNVRLQIYTVKGRRYQNVIAQFGPDTDELIVIGAHYDAFDMLPGADDNASGVAGLIELSRALASAPLKKRVELVAYSLEEPPYFRTPNMGSAVHARELKAQGKQVSLMLSLECIGIFSDAADSQEFPSDLMKAIYPTTGNFIALVGHYAEGETTRRIKRTMQAATPLPVYSVNAPAIIAGIDYSDHLNYWNEGFIGMMVTDTAFMRNENYHTKNDTPEKLDYARMALVVQGVSTVVLAEAQR